MFGQCCQEASCRPALLVGLGGKGSPDLALREAGALKESAVERLMTSRVTRLEKPLGKFSRHRTYYLYFMLLRI
jgi:hypothetical protein